ncbi:MAG TPA: sigma 54-interacting transcriptional regulator [Vicinamibacterales bacterium]
MCSEAPQHGVDGRRGGDDRSAHSRGWTSCATSLCTPGAGDFPVGPQALREYCGSGLDDAAGGSMLIDAVEEMPPSVQDTLIELLAGPESTRRPSAGVRLISGTTVSLLDRIAAGTFSEQLFYRLNIIHLMACDRAVYVEGADDAPAVHVHGPSMRKLAR